MDKPYCDWYFVEMLTVRNVALMTGISEHTLRAWEKRHKAIVPVRAPGGRRDYSMDEVRRIKVLSNLIQQGHQIGQLAHINTNELESLWSSLYSNGVTLPINNSISKQTKGFKSGINRGEINRTLW